MAALNGVSGHGVCEGQPSSSDTGEAAGHDLLAVQMGELARSLQQEDTLQDTLQSIVVAAVDTVPGAQYAGISEVQGHREIYTPAWTDELVRATDTAQYETGQGPCLKTIAVQQTVRVSDMASDDRWPEFAKRAVRLGVGSMLSFQLYVVGDNLGALNLYSREPAAFDDESEHVGLLFASHAAVAMAGAQRNEQLNRALGTRDLIGQAKGILMERHNSPLSRRSCCWCGPARPPT
jgi:transcriptional regulator with GAF, ATPase, and Fis domain